jgi:hypothetical protein
LPNHRDTGSDKDRFDRKQDLKKESISTEYLTNEKTTMTAKTSRIAFGSCNDQDRKNNLWPIIESRNPAAFIWGGDSIYAGNYYQDNLVGAW